MHCVIRLRQTRAHLFPGRSVLCNSIFVLFFFSFFSLTDIRNWIYFRKINATYCISHGFCLFSHSIQFQSIPFFNSIYWDFQLFSVPFDAHCIYRSFFITFSVQPPTHTYASKHIHSQNWIYIRFYSRKLLGDSHVCFYPYYSTTHLEQSSPFSRAHSKDDLTPTR